MSAPWRFLALSCLLPLLWGLPLAAQEPRTEVEPLRAEQRDLADPPTIAEGVADSYTITPGDEVAISVFGQPTLSATVKVSDVGVIKMPFVGEIRISGQTAKEVERIIEAKLSEGYLVDPKVTVSVVRYRVVYVNGEVRKTGSIAFEPGLTIRKAISLAGGLTERASTRKMYVVSESVSGPTKPRRVQLDDALAPGDILTIEQSFF